MGADSLSQVASSTTRLEDEVNLIGALACRDMT